MEHFRQVGEKIHARGWSLGPERKDNYVDELMQLVRKDGGREERLVDRLLFSAMIEARSCERFKMLTEQVDDAELRDFYLDLMAMKHGYAKLDFQPMKERFDEYVAAVQRSAAGDYAPMEQLIRAAFPS